VRWDGAALLIAAFAIAMLTPLYISYAIPSASVYHRNGMVFLTQTIPYAVFAAIWLPIRRPGAAKMAHRIALLLFVAACLIYLPSWVRPRSGGDMVGLGYILACLVTTGVVVVLSIVALTVLHVRRRNGRG